MGRAVAKRLSLRIEMIQKRRSRLPPVGIRRLREPLASSLPSRAPELWITAARCDVLHIEIVQEELRTFQRAHDER